MVSRSLVTNLLTQPTPITAGTSASGTGDITPGLPADHKEKDILLLFVQSSNQAVTAPGGYSRLGPAAGFGTAASAGSTRLTIFWKRDGGSESDPTVVDTGDHTLAQILGVRYCVETDDPFLCVGARRKTTASITGTASAGSTPVDKCLVVNAFAHALDSASAVFSAFTNADLTSVTEQIDVATADGNGGGIGVSTGIKSTAGSFTSTTVTETSTTDVSLTFILLPKGIKSRTGFIDKQTFITPGFADSWTRPTGADRVHIIGIGGGASGSAGRNAATAAGGGGGGGAGYSEQWFDAYALSSTLTGTVTCGAGGAATANTDGAASNAGSASTVVDSSKTIFLAQAGQAAGASASGSGGVGGNGGGRGAAAAAGTTTYDIQGAGGGTGGTTAAAGGTGQFVSGGAGAGGGTTQAASAGGNAEYGGGGGGGGRSNTNVGTGGGSVHSTQNAGGSTAGASGTDSPWPEQFGGSGAAGGTSAAGPGGTGGYPGGGGGGGGSQSGAQRGGAGADGILTIISIC